MKLFKPKIPQIFFTVKYYNLSDIEVPNKENANYLRHYDKFGHNTYYAGITSKSWWREDVDIDGNRYYYDSMGHGYYKIINDSEII